MRWQQQQFSTIYNRQFAESLKIFVRIIALFLAIILTSCSSKTERVVEISGPIMGTSYHIKVVVRDESALNAIRASVKQAMIQVDSLMSTYKPSSEISQFNK